MPFKAEHLDQFADELGGLFTVKSVMDALHAFVHPTVSVFATFRCRSIARIRSSASPNAK